MVTRAHVWRGTRVLVTGHTGFKGAWLTLWLTRLGAEVHGLALGPPTQPNLFDVGRLVDLVASDTRADIRDYTAVRQALLEIRPEVVFHLAAQPLVTYSYREPIETFGVNVMGTVHVLEATRQSATVKALIIVTSDKCYSNREWVFPYREIDRLGGFDPYSNSKACAELVAAAYRSSYFPPSHATSIATVRAGNVIGGGDWASDRLVPDCIRAFLAKRNVEIRSPEAVRPWQHVLEPLDGYIRLAEKLLGPERAGFADAWNFGPDVADTATVGDVSQRIAMQLGINVRPQAQADRVHEAQTLRLDSAKARAALGWRPRWRLAESIERTVEWYRQWSQSADMQPFSISQIEAYEQACANLPEPS